jgi:putative colanic acid biosynthesis acetyltransferase WcaB
MGIELPLGLNVGQNLTLHHGQALVIHHQAVIGQNCILRHSTTIGNRRYTSEPPEVGFIRIGNNVDIGANVVILGPIEIGDHAQIGAGSVVLKDVPPYSIVVGNPAKILRIKKSS